MASVASGSPSGQVFLRANSSEDTDSWQCVEGNASPAGYVPSPGSSLGGWGIIGYPNHLGASPTIMSPLPPTTSHPKQESGLSTTADDTEDQFLSLLDSQQFMTSHDFLFPDFLGGTCTSAAESLHTSNILGTMDSGPFEATIQSGGMCDVPSFEGMDIPAQSVNLDIPIQYQDDSNVDPWAPMSLQDDNFMFFNMEDVTQMSRTSSHISVGAGSPRSSPGIPSVKPRNPKDTADPTRKIRRGNGRVEKKKSAPLDNFVVVTPNTIHQQSGKPNPFECFEVARGVQRGRKGPLANKVAESALNIRRMGACFCCRSRKVKCDEERPCKNCKKIAVHVPQVVCWQFSDFLPVLFPDFIRGHFKKEAMARFVSENVAEFYRVGATNATSPCLVELSSGPRFRSTLTVPASLFAPRGAEVLRHWHMGAGAHQLYLHARAAVPVGINPRDPGQREALRRRAREYAHGLVDEPRYAEQVTDALRSTQLPRRVLAAVQRFAQRSRSAMALRALEIYATHYVLTRQLCLTPTTLVQLGDLQQQQAHPQSQGQPIPPAGAGAFATARILNRQVKAVLDEHLLKETQALFASLGAALKPRSRAEWASCLASFLVLCLLFESIEAAADTFAVSEAEIALRARRRSTTLAGAAIAPSDENKAGGFVVGGRRQALDVCREIDNLPFRQVAYRFHAVYQTHYARELGVGPAASAPPAGGGGGPTFNPLTDPRLDADLEPAAAELAASLRALLDDDDTWHELDFLAADPILSQSEAHPYPRDITLDYTGRLLSRFLLSFTDEKYLFDGKY
ncbi:hypothetical protein F4802DRAFT_597241 [Xylaria palmicola]|nr:hypothetical protein F4802DRAFT_597241 [Xylaria palmicola]